MWWSACFTHNKKERRTSITRPKNPKNPQQPFKLEFDVFIQKLIAGQCANKLKVEIGSFKTQRNIYPQGSKSRRVKLFHQQKILRFETVGKIRRF